MQGGAAQRRRQSDGDNTRWRGSLAAADRIQNYFGCAAEWWRQTDNGNVRRSGTKAAADRWRWCSAAPHDGYGRPTAMIATQRRWSKLMLHTQLLGRASLGGTTRQQVPLLPVRSSTRVSLPARGKKGDVDEVVWGVLSRAPRIFVLRPPFIWF